MEGLLMTLVSIGGGAGIVFLAHRLGEAQARLNMLRSQRSRDRR